MAEASPCKWLQLAPDQKSQGSLIGTIYMKQIVGAQKKKKISRIRTKKIASERALEARRMEPSHQIEIVMRENKPEEDCGGGVVLGRNADNTSNNMCPVRQPWNERPKRDEKRPQINACHVRQSSLPCRRLVGLGPSIGLKKSAQFVTGQGVHPRTGRKAKNQVDGLYLTSPGHMAHPKEWRCCIDCAANRAAKRVEKVWEDQTRQVDVEHAAPHFRR
eukprot:6202505-Pleurochrysis_carterae.AAC.2